MDTRDALFGSEDPVPGRDPLLRASAYWFDSEVSFLPWSDPGSHV
jgi:hypothetical protein